MRTARRDNHIIADCRSAANVDGDDGFCLGVFETGQGRVEGRGHEIRLVHPDRGRRMLSLLLKCCSQCISFPTRTTLCGNCKHHTP
ncbi:Hypothetical protein BSSP2_II1284 [Brucella suis bv. 2]|nr:Hypothetical protein BSSP3_II1287 [Brucella suis bv. 2]AIB23337.1 Hypothetical protein BSPT1_II1274 [Brucella suis bv. 2]AIB26694.1 Hypothetical protein BSPT2_II1276 [Brucella suis bv. 2]AIB30092.1 Hypothetical protein BSSP1_II1282 [Brucella suis bv. 2]AIB33462.1 Hypothetical protein BSSP2_II1284 [Brucella suis bv. 2]